MLTVDKIRIGNYIASGANIKDPDTWVIGKVLSIGNKDAQFEQVEVETDEEFTWFFKDNYFSIPLTTEWLIKFGFTIHHETKEENNVWRKYYEEGFFDLEEIITFFFGNPLYGVEVKTVDHLQNLFYFITGEELTI